MVRDIFLKGNRCYIGEAYAWSSIEGWTNKMWTTFIKFHYGKRVKKLKTMN